MTRTTIKQILLQPDAYLQQDVLLQGWIRTTRQSKNLSFIEINDGSFFRNLQTVYDETLTNFTEVGKLPIGSALTLTGQIVVSPGSGQSVEMKIATAMITGTSSLDYPLQKKRHSFEFLRTIAHLRPRTNTFLAVFRLRSFLAQALHRFFHDRNFVYIHTPIVTGSDCEGAGQMFRVTTLDSSNPPRTEQGTIDFSKDFFGKETFLTVSGQLNVEAFCMAFDKVYTFGPTFRAENSYTQRHAAEFWMIEPEIAFAGLTENMKLAEEMIKYLIREALEKLPEEMEFFNRFIDPHLMERLLLVRDVRFEHVTYTEAIQILQNATVSFQFKPEWGMDLQTEHERYLTESHFQKPVFVTDYPKRIKAFYMRLNDDDRTVAAMDLLVPEVGEIIGGSQREERLDILQKRILELNLPLQIYQWYLDLRRYGGTPHSGFGLGFERLIMYLSGMENIRDVIPYPRTTKNADF